MLVAAKCGCQLFYSVYGDSQLKRDLHVFHEFCVQRSLTVGECSTFSG